MHPVTSEQATPRRDVLKSAVLAAGGLALTALPKRLHGGHPPDRPRALALRVAHMTDLHIQPEREAVKGVAAALHHVQALHERPDLILTGGDLIMDSFAQDEARTKLQWGLLRDTLKNECSIHIEHTLGNHDVWGWHKSKSRTRGDEPLWGKKWACDQLALARPYHSFTRNGWHFICLDSIDHDPANPDGYIGNLGEEQLEWLARDLAATDSGTPVLVVSHIPILSVTGLLGATEKDTTNYKVSGGLLHTDSHRIRALFAKHPNVKLCLSGHMHRIDRTDYLGVTYFCNGAVSGNWWKGAHYECNEGYAVLELYTDGTFDHRYVPFGWTARG